MEIPHEEARRLIEFNADNALNSEDKNILSMHLKTCVACRAYAEEIRNVESILLPVMKRQWDLRPIPLSIGDLKAKRGIKAPTSNLVAIRTALISFVFVVFAFSVWQFARPTARIPGLSPVIVSSVPTPSLESTNTSISPVGCYLVRYTVQAEDTLASIAEQFSLSKNEIITSNNLKTESIHTGITLMIPTCNFTPTGAAIETLPTTLTPVISSTTSSPEATRY
jgi:LysM repeat protein